MLMEEKNVSPVSPFLWTKTLWFLSFPKAWPTQDLVRLFGDRKCEVGYRVQMGEMGLPCRMPGPVHLPIRSTLRHKQPTPRAGPSLMPNISLPPKQGKRPITPGQVWRFQRICGFQSADKEDVKIKSIIKVSLPPPFFYPSYTGLVALPSSQTFNQSRTVQNPCLIFFSSISHKS